MAKKLNIELTVRRMEAQNILTTSGVIHDDIPTTQMWAAERTTPNTTKTTPMFRH